MTFLSCFYFLSRGKIIFFFFKEEAAVKQPLRVKKAEVLFSLIVLVLYYIDVNDSICYLGDDSFSGGCCNLVVCFAANNWNKLWGLCSNGRTLLCYPIISNREVE